MNIDLKVIEEGKTISLNGVEYVRKKPEPKPEQRIDWSKMPKGIIVEVATEDRGWQLGLFCGYDPEEEKKYKARLVTDALPINFRHIELIQQNAYIRHLGGSCPVPKGISVDVILKNGDHLPNRDANQLEWDRTGASDDIVAYRIVGLMSGWIS